MGCRPTGQARSRLPSSRHGEEWTAMTAQRLIRSTLPGREGPVDPAALARGWRGLGVGSAAQAGQGRAAEVKAALRDEHV